MVCVRPLGVGVLEKGEAVLRVAKEICDEGGEGELGADGGNAAMHVGVGAEEGDAHELGIEGGREIGCGREDEGEVERRGIDEVVDGVDNGVCVEETCDGLCEYAVHDTKDVCLIDNAVHRRAWYARK